MLQVIKHGWIITYPTEVQTREGTMYMGEYACELWKHNKLVAKLKVDKLYIADIKPKLWKL